MASRDKLGKIFQLRIYHPLLGGHSDCDLLRGSQVGVCPQPVRRNVLSISVLFFYGKCKKQQTKTGLNPSQTTSSASRRNSSGSQRAAKP